MASGSNGYQWQRTPAPQAALDARASTSEYREASAERLPLAIASIDLAIVYGIFNLNPARDEIFRDPARVIRPGWTASVAELILADPLSQQTSQDEASWLA